MDAREFSRQSNVVIVMGKGGVGKSTVAAALATVAARTGLDVMIALLDDSSQVNRFFGVDAPLGADETLLQVGGDAEARQPLTPGRIRTRLIRPELAFMEYLGRRGLGLISKHLADSGVLDVIATAAPGVRELLTLDKIKQIEQDHEADLIVLDAPATGHALTLLTSPAGLANAAQTGPLHDQATQVVEFLSDEARCQILLVTIPEETPISEVIESGYRLEDEINIALGAVVVNACLPMLAGLDVDPHEAAKGAGVEVNEVDANRIRAAAQFRQARQDLQQEQLVRLARDLPLPQIRLPYLFRAEFGTSELSALALDLEDALEKLQ